MITANLYGVFRVEIGQKSLTVDVPEGTSVGNAILSIVDDHPALRKFWIAEDGGLSGHVLVAVNGVEVYSLPAGLQTPLKDNDRLDFFSPLAGG
jgi:sulfur-carrier protein